MISKLNRRIILSALIAISVFSNSTSQSLSSIEGKVFDSKTKESLPGATVYLANTTVGFFAGSDGSFLLNKITTGKYDLTVTMIGYKTFSRSIAFDGNSIKGFNIYLDQNVIELNFVEVKAKRESNKNEYFKFEKLFLGQTQNSSKCRIINPHDIFAYKDGSSLIALSHKPIEIVNNALGYRIFYELKEFVINYAGNTITISGIPRFENLTPESKKQEARWIRERDRAYYGSMEHFIRSLKRRELKKNRFALYDIERKEVTEEDLLKEIGDSVISYKGKLNVIFNSELSESSYDPRRGRQESELNFVGRKVTIYENGYYEGFHDVLLLGYMGWSSRIAELVPLGYEPTSKLK